MKKTYRSFLILLLISGAFACEKDTKWEGQGAIQVIPTTTLPVQQQFKTTFDLGNGVFASNQFAGARLNGISRNEDSLIIAYITSENTPVNSSPWYAFKLWADVEQKIDLKLTYQTGGFNRYSPKFSTDGLTWKPVAPDNITADTVKVNIAGRDFPRTITMHLSVGRDTLWIAAQELNNSTHVKNWVDGIAKLPFASTQVIGKSKQGRDIDLLKIGEPNDENMIFVLSRQHPPEVTGYLAMQAFVEKIADDDSLAQAFRLKYTTYVVPLANPDGVDNGHWRHSFAGRDLNRDWQNVNQPEVAAIQHFMENKVAETGGTFIFAVDFHSTWEDIFYTIDPEMDGNKPGLVPAMIHGMAAELGLEPNIRPNSVSGHHINSTRYFFSQFGAESLTYELGDGTPRDLLHDKGEVSAIKLMELLLKKE